MLPRQLILLSWSARVDGLMSKRCHYGPVCSESSELFIAEVTDDDNNSYRCLTHVLSHNIISYSASMLCRHVMHAT